MKCILCLFLSIVLAANIYAQQNSAFRGRVINDAGDGVQKASVVLLNTGLGAITDGAGYFQLPSPGPGKYQLLVTAMGYASMLKETDFGKDTGLIRISMSPSYAHLDEVIVSAEKAEERLQSRSFHSFLHRQPPGH